MKFGFDYHGVLDSNPKLFSEFTKLLKDNNHEIHILTGSQDSEIIREELRLLEIHYTHFFSVTDHNKRIGTKVWYDENQNPWMDKDIWEKTKGEYCERNKIDLHLDDTHSYGNHFKTGFCRYYSKHIDKKFKETILPIDET